MLRLSLLLICSQSISFSVCAQSPNNISFWLSSSQSNIQFAERVAGNKVLNQETGQIRGVVAGFAYNQKQIGIEFEVQRASSRLDYTGLSQNGQSVETLTSYDNQSASVLLSLPLYRASNSVFFKLGGQYSQSNRDIATVGNIRGLDEQYQYTYLVSEVAWQYIYTVKWSFRSDYQFAWLADGSVKVDYHDLYDPNQLELEQGYKHTLAFATRYHIFDDLVIDLGLHYLLQKTGPSQQTKLRKNHQPIGQVYQPERKLRLNGLHLKLEYTF